MRKGGILIGCLGLIVLLALMAGAAAISARNKLVQLDENVNEKWAQVQNVYQRRADLIPNLVNTVKGYAAHERETLEAVIRARAAATSPLVGMAEAPTDPQQIQKFEAAQGALSAALSRLMVVVERYPQLRANENFLALQSQLEGTENRITVERQRYNQAVRQYNTQVRSFPTNVFAGLFGFERRVQFEARPGADVAPEVRF